MNGKPILYREAKTVLTMSADAFREKQLCDGLTLNLGDACAFSCAYCYVPAAVRKLVHHILAGQPHMEVVIRRKSALDLLRGQLLDKKGNPRFADPADTRVLYSSTLVDVAGNLELAQETAAACAMILEYTQWQIRLLTKSHLLPELVALIPAHYHHRLILGVSTGTLDDRVARSIEAGTALVSKRIKSLHRLQDAGLRTFGMICPSLPQADYSSFAKEMAQAIRVDRCEHVWAEVINLRGASFTNTLQALTAAGLTDEAHRLAGVCGLGSQAAWESYARETFGAHARVTLAGKLRFLQYVTPETAGWWQAHEEAGAVCLGRHAKPLPSMGPSSLRGKK